MKVEVISATPYPLDVISMAAGVCYGKPYVSHNRARHCFKAGHLSVFEHASITFKIEGISRSCMAQLTRHRHISPCVESQRYCRYDFEQPDWYIMPEAFEASDFVGDFTLKSWYQTEMEKDAKAYLKALESGVKPEDARYLLPEATKTNMVVTMNCREFFHILDMRWDKAAQWEIRNLAEAMFGAAHERSEQWASTMEMYLDGKNDER